MRSKVLFILLFVLTKSVSVSATTYYLNTAGNDTDTGTSPAHAWRTTTRVSAAHFEPGDQVRLAGGQSFDGGIWLRGNSQGTASQPIVFRSYGVGRATILSGDTYGFYAQNTAGIELRQLNFVGAGRLSNKTSGVIFYLDSANTHLRHLRLDSLEVSGYRSAGISIGSWNGLSGYSDVRLTHCQLHANGEAGLSSYAAYPLSGYAHHDWYVGDCTAYDNAGRADVTTTHTGNGIVLSGIDGALVEHCTAYHNGWLNANPSGGPVGIWGWSCNALTIQLCESHHNLSGTTKDGGGFDLDGGCTNSLMQYNYAHDNQGPGYLLAQFNGAPAMHDLTVRYNISENDARQHGQGAIALWSSGDNGGIERAAIYNNSVYLSAPADGSVPSAVYVMSGGISEVTLRNNLLQTAPGLPVLLSLTATGLRLEGNCYWTPGAALLLHWNGTSYPTLAAWRAATGQETLAAGTRPTGLCADPALALGGTPASTPLSTSLARYNPGPGSALAGTGLGLVAEFGLNPGPRDFFGNATPGATTAGNIGASEARPTALATAGAAPAPAQGYAVFPTVVRGELHVLAPAADARPLTISLFDLLGRPCGSWQRPGSQLQAGSPALALPHLAPGPYVLRLASGTYVQRQSLVVAAE